MRLIIKLGIILIIVLFVLFFIYVFYFKHFEFFQCTECSGGVGSEHGEKKSDSKLLPIMDPEFNFRECAKQFILLEDHLFNNGKRCKDCIKKHFLTAEGLCEEAASLDKNGNYDSITKTYPNKIRELEKMFLSGVDPSLVAQEIRNIRKPLHTRFFGSIFKTPKGSGAYDKSESCSSSSCSLSA